MSRAAKWIWKLDTPASVPAGARISAGKFGSVARSLPSERGGVGEAAADELHAVAGISGEPHDDPFPLLDALRGDSHDRNLLVSASMPIAPPTLAAE